MIDLPYTFVGHIETIKCFSHLTKPDFKKKATCIFSLNYVQVLPLSVKNWREE